MELDLSSLASVRKFAADSLSSCGSLNILMSFSFDKFVIGQDEGDSTQNKERGKDCECFLRGLFYSSFGAYGQSKLANILHAYELTRRLKGASTTCYVALHPQLKGISGEYFWDNNSDG
ncbi:hypothetical protein RND71_030176 [Anisodus tanguticus]|uniref:Uncharacterized protein n=1 Tax=Anisodus tanguticus TaxID=243964 RepID=A0AAE1RFW4_9SOLA|nr:hypothetical protein RND71_030176 [Anisodus tanguticus]